MTTITPDRNNIEEEQKQQSEQQIKQTDDCSLVSKKFTSYHRLINYFIVCGLGRSIVVNDINKPYQTEILDRYPHHSYEDAVLPQHIWMFSFPSGLWVKETMEEPTISAFCLTELDGARFYATSLTYYKEIEDSKMENEDYQVLFKPVSITLLSRYPCYSILKKLLCYIYLYSINNGMDESNTIPIERIVSHLINDLPRPILGYRFNLNLPEIITLNHKHSIGIKNAKIVDTNNLNYTLSNLPNFPQTDIPFTLLFNLVGVNNVLLLFSAILQERKVLFFSTFNSLLTVACETILNLLYPFIWPHVYIPVLPDLLVDFLQAPTPFIVGMVKHKNLPKIDYSDILVIDLDKQNIISKPDSFNNSLPEIYFNKLEKSIKKILYPELESLYLVFPNDIENNINNNNSNNNSNSINNSNINNSKIDNNIKIRATFLGFFISFFYDIDDYRYLLRKYPKPILTFNKSSFLMKHKDPEIVNFLSTLIETSAITAFLDGDQQQPINQQEINNNNSNNTSNNNYCTLFFDLVCKQYKEDLEVSPFTANAYESIITCICNYSQNFPQYSKSIEIPKPDGSELNPLLSNPPHPRLQFPDLNKSLFSKRNEFSRESLMLKTIIFNDNKLKSVKVPSSASTSIIKSQSKENINNLLFSPKSTTTNITTTSSSSNSSSTSNTPVKRGSILVASSRILLNTTTTTTATTADNNESLSHSPSSDSTLLKFTKLNGEVEPVTNSNQLEDEELLKEFIEKYTELIFSDDFLVNVSPNSNQQNQNQQQKILNIDFEQQKLLLDLFKLKNSREYFMNSLSIYLNEDNNKSYCLDSGWRLLILVEIMKKIFNECNNAADFKTASNILQITKDVYFRKVSANQQQTQQEPLFQHFQGVVLWKNLFFWESSFLDGLKKLRVESLPDHYNNHQFNDYDLKSQQEQADYTKREEDVLFNCLSSFSYLMIRLKISIAEVTRFIGRMVVICNINDDHYQTLISLVHKLYHADPSNFDHNKNNNNSNDNSNDNSEKDGAGSNSNSFIEGYNSNNDDMIKNSEISNIIEYNKNSFKIPDLYEDSSISDLVGGDIKYFTSTVKRNIDIEKNGSRLYYQKLIEMKRNIIKNGNGLFDENSDFINGNKLFLSSSTNKTGLPQFSTINVNNSNNGVANLNGSFGNLNTTNTSPNSSLSTSLNSQSTNLSLSLNSIDLVQQQQDSIVYDKKDGYSVMTLKGSGSAIQCISMINKRQVIVGGCTNGSIVVWNYNDGKLLQRLSNHKKGVSCIGVDQSIDSMFASGSRDKTLRIWNYNGSDGFVCSSTLQEHSSDVSCLEMKGNMVLTGSTDSTMIAWDARSNRKINQFTGHTGQILSIAMFETGNMALTTSSDTTVRLWDIRNMKPLQVFSEHNDWVTKAVIGNNGQTIFSGSFDTMVKMWDINTPKSIKTFSGHAGGINCLAYDSEKKILVSGGGDGYVKGWDVQTGFAIKSFKGHKDEVLQILYEGDTMITSSQDQTIRIWDMNSGLCQKVLRGHTDWICSLANGYDSVKLNKFISGSWDSTVKVWEIEKENQNQNSGYVSSRQDSEKNRIASVLSHQPLTLSSSSSSSSSPLSSTQANTLKKSLNNSSGGGSGSTIFKKSKGSVILMSSSPNITTTTPTNNSNNSTTTPSTTIIGNKSISIGSAASSVNSNLSSSSSTNSSSGGSLSNDVPVGSISSLSSSISSLSSSSSSSVTSSWQIGSPTNKPKKNLI
ncbi:hypothetical protein DICPUDRAFT_97633 [Dictyostelium purpureum]|uniref:UDENN domain-containing protein n=1 Tax=Dictyostelium purpureum TaxID=5786 RepID=F0ZIE8_DICPU|nr:uncharacterized protein DICPUDRAFT_97633 [Dictyostelium purpureum]EGC36245.1 hypothetical protein DICPUDRAFT_97633 [Dictyostelium purpureum]|eukprot:XP_003287191.1 hypothetical protein DICPUDRAFT_97633 [Dictyostelium purpureum]